MESTLDRCETLVAALDALVRLQAENAALRAQNAALQAERDHAVKWLAHHEAECERLTDLLAQ
jgi:hypothetical protein